MTIEENDKQRDEAKGRTDPGSDRQLDARYQTLAGDFADAQGNYAILVTRWNSFIVESLKNAALATLHDNGIDSEHVAVCYVPGAFELPLAAKRLAASERYQAVIALGAVIRGDTPHFDYVAGECAKGLSQAALDTGVPVIFGVLTVDNIEQAKVRSAENKENKGAEAACAAMEMVSLLKKI